MVLFMMFVLNLRLV